jgi:hypothetical protein
MEIAYYFPFIAQEITRLHNNDAFPFTCRVLMRFLR